MKRRFSKGFIAVDQRLFESDLDIYHINIISWILSYQVQDQPFFMSKTMLAEKFGCERKTIVRRMDYLESYGILVRGEKYKRMYKYQVNTHRLDMYLTGTHLERNVPDRYTSSKICTSEVHYNNSNNKTSSNKTSFGDEDDFRSSSSKPKKTISENDLAKFLNELDI